jgi:hypothetical protein
VITFKSSALCCPPLSLIISSPSLHKFPHVFL